MAVSAAALLALTAVSSVAADYPTTVSSFNPVAYWQLNGTTPVPLPDVATNSGALGALAQGTYIQGVVHPVPGIPGAGADTAMNLTNLNIPSGGLSKLRIPWASQLNSNAPFSVEFWARPAITDTPSCPASSVDYVLSPRLGWLFYQTESGNVSTGNGWLFRIYKTDGSFATVVVADTLDTTAWYHVVGVYDGTNLILYTNGVEAATSPVGGVFAANTSPGIPLDFGGRGDGRSGNYGFGGDMDEAAYYGKALSADRVLAHYQAGINTTAPFNYDQVVKADAPLGYWRMDEPAYVAPDPGTLPVAVNSGTLGAAANGTTYPGVTTGVAGPPGNGMGADNYACNFDGGTGYIDCGTSAGFNIANNMTVMAWVKIKGWSHMNEGIVTKGMGSWGLGKYFTQSFYVNNQMDFRTPGASVVDNVGTRVVADGLWHHVVGVYDGSTSSLYIDGTLDSAVAATGGIAVDASPVYIGDNVDWIASGSGSYMEPLFDGDIAQVAVFPTAFTATQVMQVFNSAQEPPVVTQQPQGPTGTAFEGATVTLQGAAIGGLPLRYQWTKNGTALPGMTTNSLVLSMVTTNDSGNYALVFNNDYGSVTSAVVALTVQFSPPTIEIPRRLSNSPSPSPDTKPAPPRSRWSRAAACLFPTNGPIATG
jgi:hypothetical protein